MRRIPHIVVVAASVLMLLASFAAQAQAQGERRVALVIGNSTYREAPLKNPANDAKAMAATLRKQGFKVILRQNASKSDMEDAIAEFGEQLTQDSVGLFFFAGHGMQVNGRNFLVPTDAKVTSEQRVRLETLDVDIVLDQMQAAKARVSMVILDACRNNPFERRFRSFGGGLAQINAPEGTIIAYATAPGKVASDGDGTNGLYTTELLRAMQQPGARVEDVFKQVRVRVSRASSGNQVPWEASSLVGDFYFTEAPKAAAAAAAPAIDRETLFWDSVKDSSNRAELDAYLAAFPNGVFAGLARARIAALEPPAALAPAASPRAEPEDSGKELTAAFARPAPAAEPRQQTQQAALPRDPFDGSWYGEYGCHAYGGFREFRQYRGLTIDRREVTFNTGTEGQPGSFRVAGRVSESGSVSMDGRGNSAGNGSAYPIRFWGKIEGNTLSLEGTQGGGRSCWITMRRN